MLIRWSLAAEKRWPGILYVAASRPENMSNLALETPIVESDLNFDRGELAVWNLQNREVERLCVNAMAYRAQVPCAPHDLVRRVLAFCGMVESRAVAAQQAFAVASAAAHGENTPELVVASVNRDQCCHPEIMGCVAQWRASATSWVEAQDM